MGIPHYSSQHFYCYLDSNKAWEVIEGKTMGYDRDIDELYPENFITENNIANYNKAIQQLLLPDEQYYLFDSRCEDYALTSLGRIFNVKYLNQLSVYFSSVSLITLIRDRKFNIATEFAKHNWPFNIDTIKHTYNNYKWKYCIKGIFYNHDNK